MASAFSHALVGVAIGQTVRPKKVSWRFWFWGIFCSVIPDVDVIGFHFGIQYGDFWGHRGVTHSFLFAALLGCVVVLLAFQDIEEPSQKIRLFFYFFLTAASHGVLDAMTNGGMGVAFFSPFNVKRYFFSFRPIEVSPIGVARFFHNRAIKVLLSEIKWIWIPVLVWMVVLKSFFRSSKITSPA